jgi:hypothetical protein
VFILKEPNFIELFVFAMRANANENGVLRGNANHSHFDLIQAQGWHDLCAIDIDIFLCIPLTNTIGMIYANIPAQLEQFQARL